MSLDKNGFDEDAAREYFNKNVFEHMKLSRKQYNNKYR